MNAPKLRFKEFNDEWEKVKLSSQVSFLQGLTYTPNDVSNDGTIVLRSSNIQNSMVDYNDIVRVNIIIPEKLKIKENDILMCVRNGSKSLVGKTAWLSKNEEKCTWGAFMNIIRPKEKNKFIYYYLNSKYFYIHVWKDLGTATVNQITKQTLESCCLNIPSTEEQEKISNTLSLLDKKIELQTKKIEDLKLFKKGLINKLFENINSNIKIKDVASLKNGYSFKNELYDINGKYNILTISNVTGDMYISKSFKNKYKEMPNDIQDHQILKENDILISLTGNVGRVSLNTGTNNLLNQRVGLLEVKKNINERFLFYVLNNIKFENKMISKGQGAAQLNISKNDIENYIIPYPIEEEQIKIVNILDLYFKKIYLEKEKLNALNELKKGLMQNMFV